MGKITGYIRKSHYFTKEALNDLGILSRYMGDIGESAVLRYLIINEIRKIPAFQKPTFQKPMRITLTDKDVEALRVMCENQKGAVVAPIKVLDDDTISRVSGEDEE